MLQVKVTARGALTVTRMIVLNTKLYRYGVFSFLFQFLSKVILTVCVTVVQITLLCKNTRMLFLCTFLSCASLFVLPTFSQEKDLDKEIQEIENKLKVLKEEVEKSKNKEVSENTDKEKPAKYKSKMKGKIPMEFLKSYLAQPEHIKAVRESEKLWFEDMLKIGFNFRPRFDSSHNLDFDKRTSDTLNFGTQNTQLYFIGSITDSIAFKLTIQDVRLYGGNNVPKVGPIGRFGLSNSIGVDYDPTVPNVKPVNIRNNTDIREAFIHLKDHIEGLEFFIGRQIFAFGDNRYVGHRNDTQMSSAFDGLRVKYNWSEYLSSDVFTSVLATDENAGGLTTSHGVKKGSINNTYLSGFYNTLNLKEVLLDAYIFNVSRKWEMANVPVTSMDRARQRDDLNTAGFRLTNRTDGLVLPAGKEWDFCIEASWQFGNNGEKIKAGWDRLDHKWNGKDVYMEKVQYRSHFFLAQTGYTFFKQFRAGIQYAFASGDKNRSDAAIGTYDASFATRAGGFPYFDSGTGIANNAFWSNIKDYSIHLMWKTESFGRFIFVAHDTYKAVKQDAWYNTNGGANLRQSTENFKNDPYANNHLGKKLYNEYDLIWMYYLKDYVSLWMGGAVLYGGDSIRNAKTNPWSTVQTDRYAFDRYATMFFAFAQLAM
jgi:hypothetical protein